MAEEKKKFSFFVNDKKFDVEQRNISGAEIRALAQINSADALFLEVHGHDQSDRKIELNTSIDLGAPGVEKFYTVPPATFGK